MADGTFASGSVSSQQRRATIEVPSGIHAHLQALLDASSAHLALLDKQGTICAVSAAWRSFAAANGSTHDHVGTNYLHVCDHAKGPHSEEATAAAEGIRAVRQGRLGAFSLKYPCHAPKAKRWFALHVRPLQDDRLAVLVSHEDVTASHVAEESIRQANERLMTVREEEKRHLAKELHDNIGQRLFGLNMMLQNVTASGSASGDWLSSLQKATDLCSGVMRDVRMLSQGLYPHTLEALGLAATLRQCVEDCQGRSEVTFHCMRRLEAARFDSELEVAIFRIAQEAINNALRHSSATSIRVELTCHQSMLQLTVTDNGVGFSPGGQSHGIGLCSMQERAKAVGGTLEITSRTGHTAVKVQAEAKIVTGL